MSRRYEIIDNFMPENFYEEAKKFIIDDTLLPWRLSNQVSDYDSEDGIYFVHTFIERWNNLSDFTNLFEPILHEVNPQGLIRFRANLYPKTSTLKEHGWHCDPGDHNSRACIYYINSNNGKTILKGDDGEDDIVIDSVGNRALFFDSYKEHRSTTCTDEEYRCNIIVNYIPWS